MTLQAEKEINIRFSEVDSMGIVWHGNYALYFEDARELFGKTYHLEYLHMFEMGFYAPLVDLRFQYKKAIKYTDPIRVIIRFHDTEAAKIIFDYEIRHCETNDLMATGQSTQVFMDLDYNLVLHTPDFFIEWKKINKIL